MLRSTIAYILPSIAILLWLASSASRPVVLLRPRGICHRQEGKSKRGGLAPLWNFRMPRLALLAVDAADAEVFDDEIILDPVLRPFSPHARFLHSPERRDFVGDDAGVDADDAVLQGFGDAPHAVEVAAVEVGGEAEFGVVGELDRFFFVFESE